MRWRLPDLLARLKLRYRGELCRDWEWPYTASFGLSIPFNGINQKILNNTMVQPTSAQRMYGGLAIALEEAIQNGTVQGNVFASDHQPASNGSITRGWGAYWNSSTTGTEWTAVHQMNVVCGEGDKEIQREGVAKYGYPKFVDQYNYRADTCWNAGKLSKSNIDVQSAGLDKRSEAVTWRVNVVSALSIDKVEFFLDDAATPIGTQTVQDINTSFERDRKWPYHVSMQAAELSPGLHTLVAKATDVGGSIQSRHSDHYLEWRPAALSRAYGHRGRGRKLH